MEIVNQVLETVKSTAMNLLETCKEKLPEVQESVQEKIPIVKNSVYQTVDYCKRPFISREDRAEIFVLNRDNQNFIEVPEDTQPTPLMTSVPNRQMQMQMQRNKNRTMINNYLQQLFAICNTNGPVEPYDDFSPNAWKQFYPPNHPFFLWEKGYVIPNQTRIYYPRDFQRLAIYQGDLSSDLMRRHGFGVLTTPFYVRIGQWRDDRFTGWGREIRRTGEILEGKFVNGSLNGKGIVSNNRGNKYIGDFLNGRRHGQGKLVTNRIDYVGDFKYDLMDGFGKITFLKDGNTYEGEFRQNEISGQGTFTWNNGDSYSGMMYKGTMNGYGKYTYANGEVYEGYYANGVKRGRGKITYRYGKVFDGNFSFGVPEGKGSLIEAGKSIPLEFSGNKAVEVENEP